MVIRRKHLVSLFNVHNSGMVHAAGLVGWSVYTGSLVATQDECQ